MRWRPNEGELPTTEFDIYMLQILVVDDVDVNRLQLTALLKSAGYEALQAESGARGLAVLREARPDLIICDVLMPVMDGLEFVRTVRSTPEVASTRIILRSATFADADVRALADSCGVLEILPKSCEPATLLDAVARMIARPEAEAPPRLDEFEARHIRILTDRLAALAAQLAAANERLSASNRNEDALRHEMVDRIAMERTLRESQRRFSDLLRNVQLVSLMLDDEARITYCNGFLLKLTGWEEEEVIGKNWFDTFVPPENASLRATFRDLLDDHPSAWHHENEIVTRTGERLLIQWDNTILRDPAGEVIGTASIGKDVTDTRRSEQRIRRLSRVHAMLSGIGTLIVRAGSREELFREACRLAVQTGGFSMAWIGMIDPITQDGAMAAVFGEDQSYVPDIRITARDGTPDSERPGSRAVRSGEPVICNDVSADSSVTELRGRLLAKGHNSFACLPLAISGRSVGVLALFSSVRGAFDVEEAQLLMELVRDIAFALDHIDKEERLHFLAYYDGLTGLANHVLLGERLERLIATSSNDGRQLAVVMIDLERFKTINDTLGRTTGDQLLRGVAERLLASATDKQFVARLGADHFAIVMSDISGESDVVQRGALKYRSCFQSPYVVDGHELRVSAKIGAAMFPRDGETTEALFRNAEAAVRKAQASSESLLFYTPGMTESVAKNLALEGRLRKAIEREEFVLYYQPKVDLGTRRIEGVEALIRWMSPERGLVPPLEFIPLLEETGLIIDVGAWALRTAANDYREWLDAGLPAPRIAVNVSAVQLRRQDFIDIVSRTLSAAGIGSGIDIELTESLLMENITATIQKLQTLSAMGVNVSIDDFGTGYSSLAYLAKLPVQGLKIDRAFVSTMLDSPDNMTLVSTMIALAHSLRLTVVAEGVETEETARMLHLLRCDQMQGFLVSKAVPKEQIASMLGKRSG